MKTFIPVDAPFHQVSHKNNCTPLKRQRTSLCSSQPENPNSELSVILEPNLTDERIAALFAWISRAFAGDEPYNNLMLAMAAIFGTNLPPDSQPAIMVEQALKTMPGEEQLMGAPIPRFEREQASLGAMGAGQWMGQFRTRPHALMSVTEMTHIDDWISTLPRGCKRTLKKANTQNYTIAHIPIHGNEAAPHSSLAHFRCVVEHEVRLIQMDETDVNGFFGALSEAVNRYVGTTRMTGEIREYRNEQGKVIGFAHEVQKAKTVRGQWFYCTDEGSKSYVWFHSVQELVKRAIASESVDTVDLGPSGSDSFSELKARYGFESVEDWTRVADYVSGDFYYDDEEGGGSDDDERDRLMNLIRMLGRN